MSTETKVDVLAEIDACISKRDLNLNQMVKVREAVAELIEAAKESSSVLFSCIDALSSTEQGDYDALIRLDTAIVRVGGAS